jgi:hypothetical protein
MRLWRMAAGGRVSRQAGVSGGPRCQGRLDRGAIVRGSRQVAHFAGLRVAARLSILGGTRPAIIRGGDPGGPNLACLPKGCAAVGATDFCWVRRGGAWHSKRPARS